MCRVSEMTAQNSNPEMKTIGEATNVQKKTLKLKKQVIMHFIIYILKNNPLYYYYYYYYCLDL